jgi:hypothetical protein
MISKKIQPKKNKISKITNFYKSIRIDKNLYNNEYIYNHINYYSEVNIGYIIFNWLSSYSFIFRLFI